MELLPALLCIFIMGYIIYLEFKNPKYGRDIFVDISITVIILIVALYSMYEYKYDFSLRVVQLYLALIVVGIFYIGLVFYHEKHPKKKVDENEQVEDASLESEDDAFEEKRD